MGNDQDGESTPIVERGVGVVAHVCFVERNIRSALRWPEPQPPKTSCALVLRREVLPACAPPEKPSKRNPVIGVLVMLLALIGLANVLIGMGH